MADPIQYATAAEFDSQCLPSQAFRGISTPEKDKALQWASRKAASYIQKRKVLPLLTWSEDVKRAVCDLAAYDLLSRRGFDPRSGSDTNVREHRDDAIQWLESVSQGLIELVDCTDSAVFAPVEVAGPLATSDARVNWDYQASHRRQDQNIDRDDIPGSGLG